MIRGFRNFGEVIWRAARLTPEKMALQQGERQLTFDDVERRSRQLARVLVEHRVSRGERVLLMLPNDARFAECLLGVLRTGAVAVPANIKLGADALTYIAQHSDSVALIAHADVLDKVKAVRSRVSGLRLSLLMDAQESDALDYDSAVEAVPDEFDTVPVEPNDVAVQMYTSGSTGVPKGCLLSHATQWWQARSVSRCMMLDEHDATLITGPLYHANALWACLYPMLLQGGRMAVLPGFEPRAVLETIHGLRPTYLSGTPSMYTLLLAEHDRVPHLDLSSVELLMCGSAPVPAELLAMLKRGFAERCDVVESYGLTEGGANVLSPRWGIQKLGSCGLPVPDVQLRVMDDGDPPRECGPDAVGELWSRSPANLLGYYKQPDVTAARLTRDGWLKTGDLVHRDDQGYVYFRGRKDDMISVGGENVYPKEVETILLEHPDVADVCVVPAPHATKGEAPVAWVVLRSGASPTEADLQQFFLARGAAYAHPRRVFFIDALPLSGTNKVDRTRLTAQARDRSVE